mmetsp:Transcript_59982/g.70081  ORF Transcript_59982/g.70081 Transcript_59982/m.70081 type:complete len:474 (+) Transcript_59982:102-1523(+)|eukprot:CAMPEP_0194412886 /NCGR_PEP_ID=MMETSP0176-20130528/11351_1 /TAXON_ID=216777 /ORGANISM="Proboscia alata, Strain PI-D3" /LENGTH=473 /DNA_ID=CAMNT_0039215879 /DNA_START=13 /DNA_END=1434 /DNA_ORIENTATION=+
MSNDSKTNIEVESSPSLVESLVESSVQMESTRKSRAILLNFILVAILFSANHGCVVACLSLATARFDDVGAWQNGALYISYVGSSLLGVTHVVKVLGSRLAMTLGMGLYCCYVACFLVATSWHGGETPSAIVGAVIGGVGGGFLWTAQGAFFAESSEVHAKSLNQSVSESTSLLAGIFAFIYLTMEVSMRMLSSVLESAFDISWINIFGIYAGISIFATISMYFVKSYDKKSIEVSLEEEVESSYTTNVSATLRLLRHDPKMKYMFGLNAIFGLSAAFVNSYVNGEVVEIALDDEDNKYVGYLGAMTAGVAAVSSLLFGFLGKKIGKGPVLILGVFAFVGVVLPFLVHPEVENWGWPLLIIIYSLQGIGRATFEGTLRATFADFFPREKEGAFANIILQNGLASAIGYILPYIFTCTSAGGYCVEYSNGSFHNVLIFEVLLLFVATFAIVGYWRASVLFRQEYLYFQTDGVLL